MRSHVLLLASVFLALSVVPASDAGAPAAPEWKVELLPMDPAWLITNPYAINDHGWIAGEAGPDYATTRPILWRGKGYVDLLADFPGAKGYTLGFASDINNEGWLGGVVYNDSKPAVAVLWDGNRDEAHIVHPDAADVPDYRFTDSQISGLNERTEAVGMLRNFPGGKYEGERAYVWGRYGAPGTVLPIPKGYAASQGRALSKDGSVVGGAVWADLSAFRLEACAWLERHGKYEFVDIHRQLAAEDPAIVRSFVTCVDDHGRVYGMGQNKDYKQLWAFVWDERDGLGFLDTDGSVGQVWGASKSVLAGYRGDLIIGRVVALAWIREEPYELPRLPDHDGHIGYDANAHGDVVGYAMLPGNEMWWQGSDAWIATRVRGGEDK